VGEHRTRRGTRRRHPGEQLTAVVGPPPLVAGERDVDVGAGWRETDGQENLEVVQRGAECLLGPPRESGTRGHTDSLRGADPADRRDLEPIALERAQETSRA